MTVKSTTKAAETEAPEKDEAPQFVELELARIKRYIRLGDNIVYEAGQVYVFTPAKAEEVLRDVEENGFPVFRKPRAVKKAEVIASANPGDNRARTRVNDAVQPVKPNASKSLPAKAINIEDDDPEMAEMLAKIDAQKDDNDSVSV